jgi:hypothetical protein
MVSRSRVLEHSHAPLIADFWTWVSVISKDDSAFASFDVTAWALLDGGLVPDLVGVPDGARSDGQMTWPQRSTLIELLATMTTIQSHRWSVGEQRVLRPNSGWIEQLEEDFPYNLHCEISVGDGWHDLIRAMIAAAGMPVPIFGQIKSKYGGLRAYYDGAATPRAEAAISAAEYFSECVCERCGRPGKVRNLAWMATLCDDHAAAQAAKDGF